MSAFLGPIHHWLYNKVLWHEELLEEIYLSMRETDLDVNKIKLESESKFGNAETLPLEEVINVNNIHGWLQTKIESLEKRMAYAISRGIESGKVDAEKLSVIYFENGARANDEYKHIIDTPEMAFKAMNDYLLDGMPCDRVNSLVLNSEEKVAWERSQCIHKNHWDDVDGDVNIFYTLRRAWLNGFCKNGISFVEYSESSFGFERS